MIFNTSMSLNIFNFWVSVYFSDLAVRGMIQGPQGLDRAINPTRPQAIFTLSTGRVEVVDSNVYLQVAISLCPRHKYQRTRGYSAPDMLERPC